MEDRSRRRARLILIVGVLLALLAGAGTFFLASGSQTAAPAAAPTADVIVATRDIPTRTVVTAADLKVAKFNADVVPPGALTKSEDVVGKIIVIPVSTGEVILASKFAPAQGATFTVFPPNQPIAPGQPIPPGTPNYRAMSITVPDAQAVGGVIQVGDTVDILYSFQFDPSRFFRGTDPNRIADFTVKIAIERVPILARNLAVYTIRTDAATAERLAYLQASGAQLHFLLRAAQDDRATRTEGATFEPVYRTYQFKVPEKISP